MMIYLNYFENNRSSITYEPSTDKDLAKVKPIFVSVEELEEIKNGSIEKVNAILENNKF